MKLLRRIVVILAAAAVVIGLTVAVLQTPAVQSVLASGGEHGGPPAGMMQPAQGSTVTFPTGSTASSTGTAVFNISGSGSSAIAGSASAGSSASANTGATTASFTPPAGERSHNQGGNVLGLVEVAKNLLIVVSFALAIAAANWVVKRLRPRRSRAVAARTL